MLSARHFAVLAWQYIQHLGHCERRHLRARLDALYFHLYRLTRADAAYILDTLPIVRLHYEAAFGHYRTKALVLAYYKALVSGDTDIEVAV